MNTLLDIRPGQWGLLILPRATRANILSGIGYLAERGPVLVLDGGNLFNVYTVARAVRGRAEILSRIRVSRSFTCIQMFFLLQSLATSRIPVICLDFLSTFFDESLPVRERQRLLEACLPHFARLGREAGVMVSVSPPKILLPESATFIDILQSAAGTVWKMDLPVPSPEPLRLF